MTFLACVPLIAADIPAVLSLDQRCLGGLWTKSGYERELESDCSDLLVLVSANELELIEQRQRLEIAPTKALKAAHILAAKDPCENLSEIETTELRLLGVGCLWAILEEAHITTMAIAPAQQRQKLGQFLLCQLLHTGIQRGLTRATLEVRASNQKALGLYEKFEFKEAGRRKRYYSDGEDARILWRSGLQRQDAQAQIRQAEEEAIAHLRQFYRVF